MDSEGMHARNQMFRRRPGLRSQEVVRTHTRKDRRLPVAIGMSTPRRHLSFTRTQVGGRYHRHTNMGPTTQRPFHHIINNNTIHHLVTMKPLKEDHHPDIDVATLPQVVMIDRDTLRTTMSDVED